MLEQWKVLVMKYVVGVLFVVIGMILIGLSVTLRVQFGAAVNQVNPNFDAYPLLTPLIPESATSNGVGMSAAEEAAETVLSRIYGLGAVGIVSVVGGALVLLLASRSRTAA